MATSSPKSRVADIGKTAGIVWRVLKEQGPMSQAQLAKRVGVPRDLVMQAIGWLAREEKVEVEETKRGRIVSLV